MRSTHRLTAAPMALLLALAACARGDAPEPDRTDDAVASVETGLPEAGTRAATQDWAVAAAHPLATEAGAAILAEGASGAAERRCVLRMEAPAQ